MSPPISLTNIIPIRNCGDLDIDRRLLQAPGRGDDRKPVSLPPGETP